MSRSTFCPHLIIDIKLTTPEDVEDKYITPLCSFLEYVESEGVSCHFPGVLFINFQHQFPWNLANDTVWGNYLNLWHLALTQQLNRVILENVKVIPSLQAKPGRCTRVNSNNDNVFESFLHVFGGKTLAGGKSEEAIFSPSPICCTYDDFIQIKSGVDYKKAVHSWYKLYPMELPCKGQKPFIPPAHWKGAKKIIHGHQNGFIDADGREWVWDKFHKDHWDVQMKKPVQGVYDKVTPEGKIL